MLAVFLAVSPARADADARAVEIYRSGLLRAAAAARNVAPAGRMLSASEKEKVRSSWSAFLDYVLALDSIGAYHREQKGEASLVISYAAFLAQYRGALEMIDAAERLPGIDEVLNEEVRGLGLAGGSYSRVKFRFLNVARATEFAALESLYRMRLRTNPLAAGIDADSSYILEAGQAKGPMQTVKNALKIASSAAFTAWFPVQKGVAEWMGDTRVARGHTFLVTEEQIAKLAPQLEPGDVLLERREWYVSNVGLPGFWPHTALFIGDAAQRARYFNDEEVRAWVRSQGRVDGDFEAFLRERFAPIYPRADRVIEAISEGVSFTTLEHSAAADSLAVLRPRATKRDKAIAIARAFGFLGRPYDFNFDFHTDGSLVCSEVIYKAYEGSVKLPIAEVAGRVTTPPNEIVREFDQTLGTPAQQFDLVLFLDGHERRRAALPATLSDFRASWRRPKWHIIAPR